jgi:hypothetical protein
LVQRLLADGDVAGRADSIFAIIGFRPTRELRRSERSRRRRSATGSSPSCGLESSAPEGRVPTAMPRLDADHPENGVPMHADSHPSHHGWIARHSR